MHCVNRVNDKTWTEGFPVALKISLFFRDHWAKSNCIYKVLCLRELYNEITADSTDEIIFIVY